AVTPAEDVRDGPEQDLDVRPERPVDDVEVVERDHVLERDTGAEDLPRAGHTRRQVETAAVPAGHLLVLVDDERARTDQAHLAAQHVDELRELVERRPPQEPPDARDPRVVGDLEKAARLVAVEQLDLALLGVAAHGPELDDPEAGVAATDACLPEEDVPRGAALDEEGDRREQRGEREERGASDRNVEAALEEL